MSVREYYERNFGELPEGKAFHFATRMKNWFGVADFDDFLAEHEPSRDLAAVLADDDYSEVNFYEQRKPFFEKYKGLFALEATLFRVLNLLQEYGVDLRKEFAELYGIGKLHDVCDRLFEDKEAFFTLSTYAVNVIALTEELFPRGRDVYGEMLNAAKSRAEGKEKIYLYTHILLCESLFYRRKVSHVGQYLEMMGELERIIEAQFDEITMDMKFEFLVCAEMVGFEPKMRARIAEEAEASLDKWVRDERVSDSKNTFSGAEHRNVLFIMSGLDNN